MKEGRFRPPRTTLQQVDLVMPLHRSSWFFMPSPPHYSPGLRRDAVDHSSAQASGRPSAVRTVPSVTAEDTTGLGSSWLHTKLPTIAPKANTAVSRLNKKPCANIGRKKWLHAIDLNIVKRAALTKQPIFDRLCGGEEDEMAQDCVSWFAPVGSRGRANPQL